jgi:hypothetical protein
MKSPKIQLLAKFLFCVWVAMPLPALAQADCESQPHWVRLDNGLQLNQRHVFCGEWNQNRPKGFHARPGGINPVAIARLDIQSKPNAAGVYTVRWRYQERPDKTKFSSMFPDNCTAAQVINSINYAVARPDAQCPPGSPDWVHCGYNKPDGEASQYCSYDEKRFIISFSPPKDGKVNTAFPIFE